MPVLIRSLLGLTLCAITFAGCTQIAVAEEDSIDVPSIIAIREDDRLCLIRDARDSVLYDSDHLLEAPSMSPDGRFMTVFEHGRETILGDIPGIVLFGGRVNTDMLLFDRTLGEARQMGEVRFRRSFGPSPDNDAYYFAPLWWHDGEHLLLVGKEGLESLHLDGTREMLLKLKRVSAVALSRDRRRLALTDSKSVYLMRDSISEPAILLNSARIDDELDGNEINALGFSGDCEKLAVGHHRNISVLDMVDGTVTRLSKVSNPVYWLDWLSGDTGLVVLSGREDEDPRMKQIASRQGSFTLSVVDFAAGKPRKLYSQVDWDVRRAQPQLSSDGRHLSFISRHNMTRGILYILAFDRETPIRIVRDESDYRSPIWVLP